MSHQVELLMSADWPSDDTRRRVHDGLVEEPWMDLWWPVPAHPAEMGTIKDAQLIANDPHGCYYAPVNVGFFEDSVTLHRPWQDTDAEYEVTLSYDELAHLIGDTVLRIYRDLELPLPPSWSSRASPCQHDTSTALCASVRSHLPSPAAAPPPILRFPSKLQHIFDPLTRPSNLLHLMKYAPLQHRPCTPARQQASPLPSALPRCAHRDYCCHHGAALPRSSPNPHWLWHVLHEAATSRQSHQYPDSQTNDSSRPPGRRLPRRRRA